MPLKKQSWCLQTASPPDIKDGYLQDFQKTLWGPDKPPADKEVKTSVTTTEHNADMAGGDRSVAGDINAGFAFFLDCVVNLFVLAGILLGLDFPRDIVFGKIIPGAIVGILVGNLIFVAYTRRLIVKTGNTNMTALPLGIDLPTIFGICFFVMGPVYGLNRGYMGDIEAAQLAWHTGMAATFWMAGLKFGLSFIGRLIQREIPEFALIVVMGGIATVWLGAEALLGVFRLPEVGLVSFVIMAFSLIAGYRLPFQLPGAVIAIAVSTLLYYAFALAGMDSYSLRTVPDLAVALPDLTLSGLSGLSGPVLGYLGIIVPFALLIASSSINVVAGARVVGDEFDPATTVRIDSATTAITALFGGVVQTTPYFGHPTYKRMGAGTQYSLGVGIVIGVGGFLGVIAFASELIPDAVLKPILLVVAADILRLAFASGDVRHAPALLFAIVPAIINFAYTKVLDIYARLDAAAIQSLGGETLANIAVLGVLSRGYIFASLIWGTMVYWIMDKKMKRAAGAAFLAAVFTAFGVIHSVLPSAGMYLPWSLPDAGGTEALVMRLSTAYLIAGIVLFLFSFSKEDPITQDM